MKKRWLIDILVHLLNEKDTESREEIITLILLWLESPNDDNTEHEL